MPGYISSPSSRPKDLLYIPGFSRWFVSRFERLGTDLLIRDAAHDANHDDGRTFSERQNCQRVKLLFMKIMKRFASVTRLLCLASGRVTVHHPGMDYFPTQHWSLAWTSVQGILLWFWCPFGVICSGVLLIYASGDNPKWSIPEIWSPDTFLEHAMSSDLRWRVMV